MSKTQTIRERYEQDLEQCRINTDEKIKARLLKKKLDINIPCDKKTLHYLLNSFLVDVELVSTAMFLTRIFSTNSGIFISGRRRQCVRRCLRTRTR